MSRWLFVIVTALCQACPSAAKVEHGTLLRWKKSATESVRPVVEKRLALAKLRARVNEDDARLEVRVPDDGDAASVKALLSFPGSFELCEELPPDAGAGRALGDVQVPTSCLKPHVLAGEPKEGGFAQVTWDQASAKQVAELTQRLVGHRLVFVVDGTVALTAMVGTPITGTRSTVPVDSELRLQAIVGGELSTLSFESEQRYP